MFRPMVLQVVRAYRQGGNRALGEYRDRQHPGRVGDQFETMIGRAAALPEVVPQLRRYLLQYPAAELEDADSYFYWEKLRVRPAAHHSRQSCGDLPRPHAGAGFRRRGDQAAIRDALFLYRAGRLCVRRRRSSDIPARFLSTDAQRVAAGRVSPASRARCCARSSSTGRAHRLKARSLPSSAPSRNRRTR